MFWKSEVVAHAAPEHLSIAIRGEILALEVCEVCIGMGKRRVLDFVLNAFRVAHGRVIRRDERNVLAEVMVADVSTPRACIDAVSTLIGQRDIVSLLVVIGFRVVCISAEEINVLVELVAETEGIVNSFV